MKTDNTGRAHGLSARPARRLPPLIASLTLALGLAACGGGGSDSGGGGNGAANGSNGNDAAGSQRESVYTFEENGRTVSLDENGIPTGVPAVVDGPDVPTTRIDAARLMHQAGFGPNTETVQRIATQGVSKYVLEQFNEPASRYTYTLPDNRFRSDVHGDARQNFCAERGGNYDTCWRDWFSSVPVEWDFYRQAVHGRDQLRQRTAFILGQIFVASAKELEGTYAFAEYHQMLRDNAFGNFRTLLQKVTLSPFMGNYLNMVDNDGAAPNENYARELLQLFSLGTCLLDKNGLPRSGKCIPAYDNETVRNYAYALSGWTYPAGGKNPWCNNCGGWKNPTFMRGEMVAVQAHHDSQPRQLLSGVTASGGRSARDGLNAVLDSIMAHPNVGPFIGRQFIQFMVTSNPSPGYVARVAAAFDSGRYGSVGSGVKGDMKAMIAAVLLDGEARSDSIRHANEFGKLREPVLFVTGAIRALDGATDGVPLSSYQWGKTLGQPVFNAPSVFNYYPPDYPLPNSDLVAPQFGIENTPNTLARINFANTLVYWWYNSGNGLAAGDTPHATGTKMNFARFESLIQTPGDSIKAVNAINDLLLDGRMSASEKAIVVNAMDAWKPTDTWLSSANQRSTWQRERIKTAFYLMLASPHYQIQR